MGKGKGKGNYAVCDYRLVLNIYKVLLTLELEAFGVNVP